MILPHSIEGAAGEVPPHPLPGEDVIVTLNVTLKIPVPAADAATPLEAATYAAGLLDSLPLELGGVPLDFQKQFKL